MYVPQMFGVVEAAAALATAVALLLATLALGRVAQAISVAWQMAGRSGVRLARPSGGNARSPKRMRPVRRSR